MTYLQRNIGRYSLLLMSLILIYAFLASLFFAYSGVHWGAKVSLAERLSLSFITCCLLIGIVYLILKYPEKTYKQLMLLISCLNVKRLLLIALVIRLLWVIFCGVEQTSDFIEYNSVADNFRA